MVDSYYSPEWLADCIAGWMPSGMKGAILDPSVGQGALLAGVERRFRRRVELYGMDIDQNATSILSKSNPHWNLGRVNFLSERSRRSSSVWNSVRKNVPLAAVVLNPPFSYRGGAGLACRYRGFDGLLSPAAAFVAVVLQELRPIFGVWAVLPNGILAGRRCREFWEEVEKTHIVRIEQVLPSTAFVGARANTSIVSIIPRIAPLGSQSGVTPTGETHLLVNQSGVCRCVEVVRGRVPTYKSWPVRECDTPFLHTPDILSRNQRATRLAPSQLATTGEFVLLPRVGNPVPLKIGIHRGAYPVVLSDCVYALRPVNQSAVSDFHRIILASSSNFADKYVGTGALHLSIGAVSEALREIGYVPSQVKASSAVSSSCSCDSDAVVA